jgi:hypothetical protein
MAEVSFLTRDLFRSKRLILVRRPKLAVETHVPMPRLWPKLKLFERKADGWRYRYLRDTTLALAILAEEQFANSG